MLLSNAHTNSAFELSLLWIPRQAAAVPSKVFGGVGDATGTPVAGRIRNAVVAVLMPVALTHIITTGTPSQRLDGVTVAFGDVVLLTAQANRWENGLWTYAGGSTRPEPTFQGMAVRILQGQVASGWLFVCTALAVATGDATFLPMHSPVRPIVSAGGAASLVAEGTSTPYLLRGLTSGTGITVTEKPTDVMVSAIPIVVLAEAVLQTPVVLEEFVSGTAPILIDGTLFSELFGMWGGEGGCSSLFFHQGDERLRFPKHIQQFTDDDPTRRCVRGSFDRGCVSKELRSWSCCSVR